MVSTETIRRYPPSRDYLIPMLQAVQEQEGFISRESICEISDCMGLPESKIFGVATFYNQFRLNPPGKYQVQVCRGTACIEACSIAPVMTVREIKVRELRA
jgi:NADH-quinone oxidoreductase subunit E